MTLLYFRLLVVVVLCFYFDEHTLSYLVNQVDAIHTQPLSPWQTVWSLGSHASLLNQTWVEKQQEQSIQHLLANVNPMGTKRGFITASPSKVNPDYFYTWTRDASLVSYVVVTSLLSQSYNNKQSSIVMMDLNQVLYDFVDFQVYTQQAVDKTPCQCLGEPKFNVDGSPFLGAWGRPQNDGPAERAITMIQFADTLQKTTEWPLDYIKTTLKPSIYLDLDYVIQSWQEPCFDLWEETKGIHFYTLMVMRRSLLDGSRFALQYGDNKQAHLYRRSARQLERRLVSFWSSRDKYIQVSQYQHQGQMQHWDKPSGLDISILLAANLAAPLHDGFFTPESDKVLATAVALENAFSKIYPININKQQDDDAGTAMGRYPEDIYDGYGLSIGNPWFLATTAMTEFYYRAMIAWRQQGGVEVTHINYGFFKKYHPAVEVGHVYAAGQSDFDDLLHSLAIEADRFLLTVERHQGLDGALSEQYNRKTGFLQGASHLTWSYASLISALYARNKFYSDP